MDASTQSQLPTSLVEYVDQLIADKKYPDLETEVKEQLRTDLLTRVNDTINAKVIAALSDENLAAFEKLVDANSSQEEIQKFIQSKIPDSTTFLANVLFNFRKTYLGGPSTQ